MNRLTLAVLSAIIFVMSGAAQAQHAPIVEQIRTQDSVPLNENLPLLGSYPLPRVYIKWMAEIAACEHLPPLSTPSLQGVQFIEVNAEDFQINSDVNDQFLAVTDPFALQGPRIYVSVPRMWDQITIKHEFLHLLLLSAFPQYAGDHPIEYFGKCGMHPY